ncbi:hypothetical protein [Fusobacterium sp.]|uniref:hypothetical protein n=1 Tax=Fusobacterium sp. TaxID=68766 RepID=UPI00396CC529
MIFKKELSARDMEYIRTVLSRLHINTELYRFIDSVDKMIFMFVDITDSYQSFSGFFRYVTADVSGDRYYFLNEDFEVVDSFFLTKDGVFFDVKVAKTDQNEMVEKVYSSIPEMCDDVSLTVEEAKDLISAQGVYRGYRYRPVEKLIEYTNMFLAAHLVDKYLQYGLGRSSECGVSILDAKTINHVKMLNVKRVPLYCNKDGRLKLLDLGIEVVKTGDTVCDESDPNFEIFMGNYLSVYQGTFEYYSGKFQKIAGNIFDLAKFSKI